MILIDNQAGSKDLIPKMPSTVPFEAARLHTGDVVFVGNGVRGPVWIGIEYKKLSDVLDCIRTGRFSGEQLIKMHDSFDEIWLVLEGEFRSGREGFIEVLRSNGWEQFRPGGVAPRLYSELVKWLITLETRSSVRVMRTQTIQETVAWILCLYKWWQEGELTHTSHLSYYEEPPPFIGARRPARAAYVAKALATGLGWERAQSAAAHFGSIQKMVNATEKEWKEVDGIGRVLAKEITRNVK